MNRKKLMAGILTFSMMVVAGGCAKANKVVDTPIETSVETPVETSTETPEDIAKESTYEGKYWDVMESKSQTELEGSEEVYFINTKLDHVDGSFEITASKIYFAEEGLFVELNLDNGTDTPQTNIILEEFSLNEVVDYDEATEKGTTVVLLDKVNVGAFKDVVVKPGEAKLITFTIPYDTLQNEVINFDRVNYGWSFSTDKSDVYSLKSSAAGIESPAETPVETPMG